MYVFLGFLFSIFYSYMVLPKKKKKETFNKYYFLSITVSRNDCHPLFQKKSNTYTSLDILFGIITS